MYEEPFIIYSFFEGSKITKHIITKTRNGKVML